MSRSEGDERETEVSFTRHRGGMEGRNEDEGLRTRPLSDNGPNCDAEVCSPVEREVAESAYMEGRKREQRSRFAAAAEERRKSRDEPE
jgi:hypothetical protein